jgi:glycosyltransferase involved in cell wall biosynthesis
MMRRLLKWHSAKCDFIIANSENVRQDVLAACAPRAEVATIYNAIDFEKFSPHGPTIDLDAAAGLPLAAMGTIRIGLLATFAKWKGHSLFLKAVSLLPSTTPVRAYIIGAPIYQTRGSQHSLADLRAEVHRLGLTDRVGFTGFLYPPDSALRSLDVVVHASTQPEPFGMVIVEAMACGKPVIAVNSSGASEILPEKSILSYNSGDPEHLAVQLTHLLANPEFRIQLGETARQSVQKVMSGTRLASDLVTAYQAATLSYAGKTLAHA